MSNTALGNGVLFSLIALLALLLVIFTFAIFQASALGIVRGAWHTIRRVLSWAVRTVRGAWPYIRRTLAVLIVAGWVAINAYWFDMGVHPWCQVTTVTQPDSPGKVTTTQTCGLPDATSYLAVLAFAALLLYPDAKTIWIAGFGMERRLGEALKAADVATEATEGDVLAGSEVAQEVIQQRMGLGS